MGLDMWLNRNGKEYYYWRKANAIHRFFVDTVQDGYDDCREYDVDKEVIEDLRERCELVLQLLDTCPKRKVEKLVNVFSVGQAGIVQQIEEDTLYDVGSEIQMLLPTSGGFFFGSTKYDEDYRQDIIKTKGVCDDLLITMDWEKEKLTYGSSW